MPYKDKDKQRDYQRQWMIKRRATFFEGKSCVECGSTERLELDHIDPSTKTHHAVWSWSQKRRNAEIAKCQVLCYKCHKIKTSKEQSNPDVHGTRNMYGRGCRCRPCRNSQRDHIRRWRAKQK